MAFIQIDGQNWLITPTVQDKFLLVLTGVAEINFRGEVEGQENQETVTIFPDVVSPLQFAIDHYGVSQPSGNWEPAFDLEQWAPFVALGKIYYEVEQHFDALWGVNHWKPTPFPSGTQVFQGVDVDVSALAGLSALITLSYQITLLGRVVFLPQTG